MTFTSRGRRWSSVILLALLVLGTIGSSGAMAQSPVGPRAASVAVAASSPGLSAVVTWDGKDVASAPSVSSGISTDFSSIIDVHYAWSSSGPQYTISDARLQIFYFGFALGTRDILDSNPVAASNGSFDMPWDPGVLQWLLAGTYALTASLLSPNGTMQWSEQFFLHVTAPAAIGAVLPIILLLIALYEIYALARSGRQAAIPSGGARKQGGDAPTGGSSPDSAGSTPGDGPKSGGGAT